MGLTWNNIPCLWNEISNLWNSEWLGCGPASGTGGGDDGYMPENIRKKLKLIHIRIEKFMEEEARSGWKSGTLSKTKANNIQVRLKNVMSTPLPTDKTIRIDNINEETI